MPTHDLTTWMWRDALALLDQAERLHRQFFGTGSQMRCWEPPVDVVENEREIVVHIALPGVAAEDVVVSSETGGITVSGTRRFPGARAAHIHRIEIPYGHFERRVPLPMHALEHGVTRMTDGCLVLTFRKSREAR